MIRVVSGDVDTDRRGDERQDPARERTVLVLTHTGRPEAVAPTTELLHRLVEVGFAPDDAGPRGGRHPRRTAVHACRRATRRRRSATPSS